MSAQEIIDELPRLSPDEWRWIKEKVDALERAEAGGGLRADSGKKALLTPPVATPEMIRARTEALTGLRAHGGLKAAIPDPLAWQKEIRKDRTLPGRD